MKWNMVEQLTAKQIRPDEKTNMFGVLPFGKKQNGRPTRFYIQPAGIFSKIWIKRDVIEC